MDYLTEVTGLAALAVVVVQQVLKSKLIPLYFANNHPVFTNIGLSIVAAIVVTWQTAVDLVNLTQWIVYVASISVIAAITYNMTLRNSTTIKSLEDKK